MRSINEALRTYESVQFGKPPSACYDSCPVMRDQIPKEHKNPELSPKLDAYRLSVMSLAVREIRAPGSIDEIKAKVDTTEGKLPGFLQDLDEEQLDQVFECAGKVVARACRVLDITVRSINNIPAYTTTGATVELFKNAAPSTKPVDYASLENISSFTVNERGEVQAELVETPPAPSEEEIVSSVFREISRRVRSKKR